MKIRDLYVSFPVYPEKRGGQYYTVYIFKTKQAMYKHFQEVNSTDMEWRPGAKDLKNDFDAITQSWNHYKQNGKGWVKTRDIGQILFYSAGFGSGTVSHEMTHAVLHWIERIVRKPERVFSTKISKHSRKLEERVCWSQGYLVSQFWTQFYRVEKSVVWLK